MRYKILHWMLFSGDGEFHLKHPGLYYFWEWVVMPYRYGGRLGFINWCKWMIK